MADARESGARDSGARDSGWGHSEDVGSLGEETIKLLRALSETGASAGDAPSHESPPAHDSEPHVCSTGWCPVCRVVGFVKENPDVVDDIAVAAVRLASSLRRAAEAAMRPDAPVGDEGDPNDRKGAS